MTEKGAELKKYLVNLEEGEKVFIVDVWWSINLPNNPSFDEVLEEWMSENFGDKQYEYHCLDDLPSYEAGAVGC
ncbi:hypothetical protein ACOMCU_01570 [Lysinibacillus sp. UGB7]|uniref:hypothetical protein n=1 Tax=Lysinibacillus sp. UGB7 TaxID=3411039 RepID=UPI003B7C86C2